MTKKRINLASPKSNRIKNKRKKVVKALISWKIKEFEKTKKSLTFYLVLYLILFSLTAYGLITNNLLLSILTILIGFAFFIFEKKEPVEMDFAITKEGILIHDNLYSYDSLENFWIEYEAEGIKELSLKTKQIFSPYIRIPLGKENPSKIRKFLIKFLPEEEHKSTLTDLIDRF